MVSAAAGALPLTGALPGALHHHVQSPHLPLVERGGWGCCVLVVWQAVAACSLEPLSFCHSSSSPHHFLGCLPDLLLYI